MKITEIIERLDKSIGNEDIIDTMEVGYELNIEDMPYINQERLKAFWVGEWMCTDTVVGYKIYFLDDVPMCWTKQTARKSDEEFYWFSIEKAQTVRDYLLTLRIEEEPSLNVQTCDIDTDVGTGYEIEFNGNLMNKKNAFYNGQPVTILERVRFQGDLGIDRELMIQFEDGQQDKVDIRELEFPYNLTPMEA